MAHRGDGTVHGAVRRRPIQLSEIKSVNAKPRVKNEEKTQRQNLRLVNPSSAQRRSLVGAGTGINGRIKTVRRRNLSNQARADLDKRTLGI